MLDDTARKLLRIMYHFYGHFRRMPTLRELARLSGRTPGSILLGCQELLREGYIEWRPQTPVETAIILEGWERPTEGPASGFRGSGHWSD